jgi:arylsulfatase A-like enzyme
VGRIMALLDELKIADNTVLIFSSDNGGVGGYSRPDGLIRDPGHEHDTKKYARVKTSGEDIGQFDDLTDNAPLRSGKGSLYEGGTRDPFVVRWPGVVKAGETCDVPTIHVDVYPTLLEIASAPRPNQVLDGESMVTLLKNPHASLKRAAIYQHFPGYLGSGPGLWRTTPVGTIQAGDWKLLQFFEDHHLELYNLKEDIGEKNNLAEKMPEKARELLGMMEKWRESINAPMPTKNNPSEPKTGGKKKRKAANK